MALLVCWVDCWIVGASLGEVLDCWYLAGGSFSIILAGLLDAIFFLWFCGRTLGSRVRLAISFLHFHGQQCGRTLGRRVRLAISSPYLHAGHFAVGHSEVRCA